MSNGCGVTAPLSEQALRAALALRAGWSGPITVMATTGSTNDDARRAAAEGAPDGAVFAADRQESGRGQRGRTWEAEPGAALLFSCLFRPQLAAHSLPPLSLVVGSVIAERIAFWAPTEAARIGVKWPNDVYVEGRKLAGILVEAQITGQAVSSIVVGVGVNVRPLAAAARVRVRAISLEELGITGAREPLLADLLHDLRSAVRRYESAGFGPFLPALRARDAAKGRAVLLDGMPAVAAGIADNGQLRVFVDGSERAISSGDIVFVPGPA